MSPEKRALHARFDALGAAVADTFNADCVAGGGWSHTAGFYGSLTLTQSLHGLALSVRHEKSYRKGAAGRRLLVEGAYPSGFCGYRQTSITVSMDRDARAMALDIARRFIPGYLAAIGEAKEQVRKDEHARRARVLMNRLIAQVLPGLCGLGGRPAHEDTDRTHSYWSDSRDGATARAVVGLNRSATHVDLKLTGVPTELALRVMALFDPSPAIEGMIAPRAIESSPREFPASSQTIAGEIVAGTHTPRPARKRSPKDCGPK
ncbi:hypothetical protein ACMXN5_49755 (plasmid) [Embleya sp. MST-111070]